jgi:hypothetical protein
VCDDKEELEMTESFQQLLRRTVPFAVAAFAAFTVLACNRESGSANSDTTAAQGVSAAGDSAANVRGTVASVSATDIAIKTDTGTVTIKITQPFQVYDRESGKLADVKDNSFVGVTSVKQSDGSEQATEIHIFPEELRGMGEGSRMMAQNPAGGRMTNGAVSSSRMTNGAASQSRMSNGSVASANGSTYVVQYAGGSQTIKVPPKTPVTEIKATSKTLAPGNQVIILAKRGADGSLSANKGMLAGK